jgi:hypothetical protein
MLTRLTLLIVSAAMLVLTMTGILVGRQTLATGEFCVPDPGGDTINTGPLGATPGKHDIIQVCASSAGGNFTLTIDFSDPISPPSGGVMQQGRGFGSGVGGGELVGFIDFDTDQDPTTVGDFGLVIAGGHPFTSNVTEFCPNPSGMGIEAFVDLFSYDGVTGTAPLVGPNVDVPVTYGAQSLTVSIPLSELGGDKNFNFGMVLGNFDSPTDCFPGDGGFIKPSQEKSTPTPTATDTPTPTPTFTPTSTPTVTDTPPPTATPTATDTPPAPTATVASVSQFPDTGVGSTGGPDAIVWVIAATSSLSIAAALGLWIARRRLA